MGPPRRPRSYEDNEFLQHFSHAPTSFVLPTLRASSNADWKCIQSLIRMFLSGKLPPVPLNKKVKRWFQSAASNHHTPSTLRRSALQRGGSKAQLIAKSPQLLFKVATKALVPLAKKAGRHILATGATAAIDKGSEHLSKKTSKQKAKKR